MIIYISLCLLFHHTIADVWTRIKLPGLIWEQLPINDYGERRISCGNFDHNTKHKYHWRFNGTSILPERTQIHRDTFVFLSGSNAYRSSLVGVYECCVREFLGKACYSREITTNNPTKHIGVDLAPLDSKLHASEGNTYYIRLIKAKRIENVSCSKDGKEANVKYPIYNSKATKRNEYYHVKIENFEDGHQGVYNCTIRIHKKNTESKSFSAVLAVPPLTPSSASTTIYVASLLIILVYIGKNVV